MLAFNLRDGIREGTILKSPNTNWEWRIGLCCRTRLDALQQKRCVWAVRSNGEIICLVQNFQGTHLKSGRNAKLPQKAPKETT